MNRNLWAVMVISLTAICWATAFFGAGAGGVVSSFDATYQRLGQIEPENRASSAGNSLLRVLSEIDAPLPPSSGI